MITVLGYFTCTTNPITQDIWLNVHRKDKAIIKVEDLAQGHKLPQPGLEPTLYRSETPELEFGALYHTATAHPKIKNSNKMLSFSAYIITIIFIIIIIITIFFLFAESLRMSF